MKILLRQLVLLPALGTALCIMPPGLMAQTFTPLYTLNGVTDGAGPGALILSGNMLYGTTSSGGSAGVGTVFKVGTNGLNYTTLYTFTNGADGNRPQGLILSGNTLYGTDEGRTIWSPNGSLFSISTDGSGFTNFYTFTGGSDGIYPTAIIMVSNVLYGTTASTIFQVNTDGSGFTLLYTFTGQSTGDGSGPNGALLLAGNTLYGTTVYGGPGNDGTIYSYNLSTSFYTNFYQFPGIDDKNPVNSSGAFPMGGLVLSGNTLYGTAESGGTNAEGTLFAINTDGTGFTNLFNFGGYLNTLNVPVYSAITPNGSLILSNDTLFGTSRAGGQDSFEGGDGSYGTIFSITTNGTGYLNRHIFSTPTGANSTNSDGAYPTAGLVPAGNILYGTTGGGGITGFGTLFNFSLTPVPVVVTTTSLPPVTANYGFYLTFTASGGQPPYTWSIISGAVPGLYNQEGNFFFGDQPTIGTFYFTVQAADAFGITATQALTLSVINPDTLTVNMTNATPGMVITNVIQPFVLQGTAVEAGPAVGNIHIDEVYYSINNSAWTPAGSTNNWLNWFVDLGGLVPGTNTIAAYAVDNAGSVSPTNTLTLNYQIPPSSLLTDAPGTPISTNWNSGSNPVQINEGGGIGVVPLGLGIYPNTFAITARAGDVVFLLDGNGGNNRTNWAAVVRFFNPSDPNGTGGQPATEYETFYPANPGPDYFASFQLFPLVIYVPIAENISFPGSGSQGVLAVFDEIGPVDGILSGQLAAFEIVAYVQPSGFTATITYPGSGEFLGGPETGTMSGVTTITNGQAAVTNVYVQSDGGAWTSATQVNGWTNWSANLTFTNGANTIAAYAVDQNGDVSPTNSVTFNYYIETPADVSVTASAAPEPVAVGSNLVYSLILSNAGPGIASGLVISNQIPVGATFVSTTGGYLPTAGILSMSIGALNVGETNVYQIIVRPTTTGRLTNLFQLLSLAETDPNPANNSATVVSTVTGTVAASADLSLSVVPGTGPITVGASQAYYLTVSNAGPATATSVVISNQLPANETFYSVTGGGTTNNGVLLVNLGTLAAGAGTNLTLVVYPTLPPGQVTGQLTNQFQVSANETDPVLTNNSATVVTTVNLPLPGTTLTYTGSNPGGATFVANGTVFGTGPVNENVPATPPNYAYYALTATPGDLILLTDPTGGNSPTNWAAVVRFFNPNDLTGTNGLPATYQEAFFPSDFGSQGFAGFQLFPNTYFTPAGSLSTINGVTSLVATYSEFGPAGVILAGQMEIMLLTVHSSFTDLSLSASAAPQPATVGSNLVYTITVSNALNVPYAPQTVTATGVVVSNRIPANCTFVSATGGATPTNGVLLVNLGSLAEGTNVSVQVVVQPTAAGSLTNTFQVFANEFDPNVTNNSATVVSTVTNAPVVSQFIPGTPLTYSGPGPSGIGATIVSACIVFGDGPIEIFYPGVFSALTATPGDLILLIDPTGGNNPTNWAAVVRFYNPGDLTGSNGLAASYSRAFFATKFGGSGFAGFQLFPNNDFIPAGTISTTNGLTSLNGATYNVFGPVGPIVAGQEGVFVLTVTTSFTDLSLSASAAPEPVGVGNNLVYAISVTNTGPLSATGVVVSNRIPANCTFVSATGGAPPTNGVLLVNLGSLAAGTNISVQVIVQPTAAGSLTNTFQVFANEFDPNLTNNSAMVISTVTNAAVVFQIIPGTPLTVSGGWTDTGGGGATLVTSSYVFGSGPLESGDTNYEALTATPGDIILLADPTGGNNPTNWAAVARFFNPADPTGINGLAATESQAFFATNFGGSGFAGLQLFPNTYFIPATSITTNNGVTTIITVTTQFGPVGAFIPVGITDINVLSVVSPYTDLSLSASSAPQPATVGSNLVYTITVSNAPDVLQAPDTVTATGVVVSNRIPANCTFVSATGGAPPTNGVLLVNLGSLAEGTNVSIQVVVQPTAAGSLTNTFQVFANEFDPNVTNNSASVVSTVTNNPSTGTTYTTSVVNYDTLLSSNVTQQLTNYSTELIAKLPNGTVVYDQTFNVPYLNGSVQAAITTAAADLTNAGAASYTGPTETNASQTLAGTLSVMMTNGIGTNISFVTTSYIGPQTIQTGQLGTYQRTNFSAAYTGPTGGNPQALIIAPGGVDYDTLGTYLMTNLVTTTITDTNLNSSVYVMTGVASQMVDVAVSISSAPNPVAVGAPLTYSLTVTNNSLTTATGVVVSNTLPPGVTLFSLLPSEGSATNQGNVVTYSVGILPNGNAATLAIVVLPNAAGLLTNTASAFSAQTDSQPANNHVTNVTTAVSAPITNLVLTVLTSMTLNPQTGLFEQRIEVANGGPATPASVLVTVSGLPANAKVYNATGTTNGLPYVQSSSPLGVGSNVVFLLEYYVPTRVAPTNLTFAVQAGPIVIPPVISGTILSVSRTLVLANGNVLVEFSAVPGQVYAVQYSSDMKTWLTAVPAITAPANQVQWIDSGPPKTVSSPAQQPSRYYRVVLLTAH